jgi:hypothetical protein
MNNIFFCKRNQKGMKVEKEKGIQLGIYFARKKKNKMNNIFFCKRKSKI